MSEATVNVMRRKNADGTYYERRLMLNIQGVGHDPDVAAEVMRSLVGAKISVLGNEEMPNIISVEIELRHVYVRVHVPELVDPDDYVIELSAELSKLAVAAKAAVRVAREAK